MHSLDFTAQKPNTSISVLLVDDQVIVAQALKRMFKPEDNIILHYCQDANKIYDCVREYRPAVILQDLMMPGVDGLTVVKELKENPISKNIPLVVLSAKEEATIKSQAFALGANDYLVKLPDVLEVIARIKYHASAYYYWLERNQAFATLKEDLNQAARYVQSILPTPLVDSPILTDWVYIPSSGLGGDTFGYHWLDKDHFGIYLLDVCGHGVGAALLSVSVINVLRSKSLLGVNFKKPVEVLHGLDKMFKMETQNGMYFTIWYGVYNIKDRVLEYSSAGHPPALMIMPDGSLKKLTTQGMIIGTDFNLPFTMDVVNIQDGSYLYILSDGVFEVPSWQDNNMLGLDALSAMIIQNRGKRDCLQIVLEGIQSFQGKHLFEDDFSLLQIYFKH